MPLMQTSDRRPASPLATGDSGLRPVAGPTRRPEAAVDSGALLAGRPRIAIRHRDETYWLHETRQGKLLLTK